MLHMLPKPDMQCYAYQQLTAKYDVTDEPLECLYAQWWAPFLKIVILLLVPSFLQNGTSVNRSSVPLQKM